ncbi:MAG: 5'-methylthioadenosine/S-adenosylhomocysteine nucleosidase, partial [Fusobacteriaceae bacterium]
TSGGHDPKLHTGDIVLAQSTVNIGAMRTERKEYGISESHRDGIFFDVVQRIRDEKNNPETHKEFYSDKKLLEIAKKTEYKKGNLVLGVIGSADQWNRELERIKYLNEKFNTSAEEMETVAVAQVAKAYKIPFIGIRILSNTEVHNEDFNPKTALWCQEYTLDFIKKIK